MKDENMKLDNVVYIYNPQICQQCDRIPPFKNRASMVHCLIESYGLLAYLHIVPTRPATVEDLRLFHSEEYVQFLNKNELDEEDDISDEQLEFGIGYDCLPLSNLFSLVTAIAGGSMGAASALLGGAKLALHWMGGWHHAQRDEAEGFCYVNDIAIAIQKLRQLFQRILYIDLDIHHGNGVENAFAFTRHIFTLSFHQYEAGFYPGSGKIESVGLGNGRGYSVNIPLKSCIGDEIYCDLFDRITSMVYGAYLPDAIVVQCGADGLAGDPVGSGNLTLQALGHCVKQVLSWKCPTILLGGGGYNKPNASRLWAYLTSIAVGRPLDVDSDIPEHEYFPHYGPSFDLRVLPSLQSDHNTKTDIETILTTVSDNLKTYKVRENISQNLEPRKVIED